jgi:hypothetical protein
MQVLSSSCKSCQTGCGWRWQWARQPAPLAESHNMTICHGNRNIMRCIFVNRMSNKSYLWSSLGNFASSVVEGDWLATDKTAIGRVSQHNNSPCPGNADIVTCMFVNTMSNKSYMWINLRNFVSSVMEGNWLATDTTDDWMDCSLFLPSSSQI